MELNLNYQIKENFIYIILCYIDLVFLLFDLVGQFFFLYFFIQIKDSSIEIFDEEFLVLGIYFKIFLLILYQFCYIVFEVLFLLIFIVLK